MMGVEPLTFGIATFQVTFSWAVHLSGGFFSVLTPFMVGPRHCGQLSAETAVADSATTATPTASRCLIESASVSIILRTTDAPSLPSPRPKMHLIGRASPSSVTGTHGVRFKD
jgi:hypothetical protein